MGVAELPDMSIPTPSGVASVLHETRSDPSPLAKALELLERDVADAKHSCPAAVVDYFHRSPSVPIVWCDASRTGRSVQQIRVDSLDTQMLTGFRPPLKYGPAGEAITQ